MVTYKVKACWDRKDGLIECEDGTILKRRKNDPRISSSHIVGFKENLGEQTYLKSFA